MTAKEFLASATLEATQYIKQAVNSRNNADYQKLKKLFDSQLFEAKSFGDTELNILTFDWQSLERDRNWWWQLQALPFLNWFANCIELQSEEETSLYFSVCLDAMQCWVDNAKLNKRSPLVWHDHAAAYRVRNLTNWLLFCHTSGLPVSEDARSEILSDLVIEHLDWLLENKHYSKHTNHGFDQAMIALTIALMFAREDFRPHRQVNRQRLTDEVTFAFTDEGVHKENSPGYQKTMIARLKQLRTLTPLGEQKISELGDRYILKAEAFLRAITLPNGYLPMIGDTRGGDEGLWEDKLSENGYKIYDYSKSGYLVVKGIIHGELPFLLIFKCAHFSNYHRHDDDLMIYFNVGGETVLGDGGLGLHDENNAKRKFLRSAYAHSVPMVDSPFIRDVSKLPALPVIKHDEKKKNICGISNGFGTTVLREIDYSRICSGFLSIHDKCQKMLIFSNWMLGSKEVSLCGDGVKIRHSAFNITLKSIDNKAKKVITGWVPDRIGDSAINSRDYGVFLDGCRVVMGNNNDTANTMLTVEKK